MRLEELENIVINQEYPQILMHESINKVSEIVSKIALPKAKNENGCLAFVSTFYLNNTNLSPTIRTAL